MKCPVCKSKCRKDGFNKQVQKYECLSCRKIFQENYVKPRINYGALKPQIIVLHQKGLGIRGLATFFRISPASIIRMIKRISCEILEEKEEENHEAGGSYEMDEMKVLLNDKETECWLIYILNKLTNKIFAFTIGRRTKANIASLLNKLLATKPQHIHTDKLNIYRTLIPEEIHKTFPRCTNKIERYNLTLRTHLKRLSRKTICFSRSFEMLFASLIIYIYG